VRGPVEGRVVVGEGAEAAPVPLDAEVEQVVAREPGELVDHGVDVGVAVEGRNSRAEKLSFPSFRNLIKAARGRAQRPRLMASP
jgi:hypothetical protein